MKNRRSFITGIKSHSLSKKEIFFLKKYKPWGVIIFSRNIRSLYQISKLTKSVRTIFKDKNYPILIDQEGGRVNRLKQFIDFSAFTGDFFGRLFNKNKYEFKTFAEIFIYKTSFLLKRIGINLNTVPVLDLRYKNSSNIIGDRSFGSNPIKVTKIGNLFIKLFTMNKIGTIIKHIPGHGLAKVDSHLSTPTIKKNLNFLFKNDFKPFKNNNCLFAMTSHIIFKNIDPKNTVTHSKKIISLIRKKLKFKNIIITDDISMKSLKFSISENTKKSFQAGCNLVLHCNGNMKEMIKVAENSPNINKFIIKKTSQFYKILS